MGVGDAGLVNPYVLQKVDLSSSDKNQAFIGVSETMNMMAMPRQIVKRPITRNMIRQAAIGAVGLTCWKAQLNRPPKICPMPMPQYLHRKEFLISVVSTLGIFRGAAYQYENLIACSERVYHCELRSISALGTAAIQTQPTLTSNVEYSSVLTCGFEKTREDACCEKSAIILQGRMTRSAYTPERERCTKPFSYR
jgi:hypothetical protein